VPTDVLLRALEIDRVDARPAGGDHLPGNARQRLAFDELEEDDRHVGVSPGGVGRWWWIAPALPQVPAHDYQLWLIPEGGEPISAGLLRRDRDGSLDGTAVVPATVGKVRPAISLEPAGGSTSPTIVAMVGAPI